MISIIADVVVGLCLFALFTSIIINFTEAKNKKAKKEKKSIVETGTMFLFFFVFYALIRFRIGEVMLDQLTRTILWGVGLLAVVFGCLVNIKGRFDLGSNWANQVKIYKDQTLCRKGMFRHVRHPLYASLMLMFYGTSLAYPNYLAFLSNTLIFIPFMHYRARQEEALLTKTFKEYHTYQKEVGMFFPKIRWQQKH
ncbi:MAG: isoprenylcysteine carboxylmethyltransferase family protein [Nanoarchaeota archaeon]